MFHFVFSVHVCFAHYWSLAVDLKISFCVAVLINWYSVFSPFFEPFFFSVFFPLHGLQFVVPFFPAGFF